MSKEYTIEQFVEEIKNKDQGWFFEYDGSTITSVLDKAVDKIVELTNRIQELENEKKSV